MRKRLGVGHLHADAKKKNCRRGATMCAFLLNPMATHVGGRSKSVSFLLTSPVLPQSPSVVGRCLKTRSTH